jgi:hypothetical protein
MGPSFGGGIALLNATAEAYADGIARSSRLEQRVPRSGAVGGRSLDETAAELGDVAGLAGAGLWLDARDAEGGGPTSSNMGAEQASVDGTAARTKRRTASAREGREPLLPSAPSTASIILVRPYARSVPDTMVAIAGALATLALASREV